MIFCKYARIGSILFESAQIYIDSAHLHSNRCHIPFYQPHMMQIYRFGQKKQKSRLLYEKTRPRFPADFMSELHEMNNSAMMAYSAHRPESFVNSGHGFCEGGTGVSIQRPIFASTAIAKLLWAKQKRKKSIPRLKHRRLEFRWKEGSLPSAAKGPGFSEPA